jgi:hypothetical protein
MRELLRPGLASWPNNIFAVEGDRLSYLKSPLSVEIRRVRMHPSDWRRGDGEVVAQPSGMGRMRHATNLPRFCSGVCNRSLLFYAALTLWLFGLATSHESGCRNLHRAPRFSLVGPCL